MNKMKTLVAFVALLLCGGAWAVAPTPVAVWEGNFNIAKKGVVSLDAQGNVNDGDKITIADGATKGVKFSWSTGRDGYTIIAKVRTLKANTSKAQVLVTGGNNANRTGIAWDADGNSKGIWAGDLWYDSNHVQTKNAISEVSDSDTLYIAARHKSSNNGLCGTYFFINTGTGWNSVYEASGCRSVNDSAAYNCVSLGGPVVAGAASNANNRYVACSGMVIEKVAIFHDHLTIAQLGEYVFPSEMSNGYQKWAQNPAVLTWAGTATEFHNGPYTLFDIVSGADTTTSFAGNTANQNVPGRIGVNTTPWQVFSSAVDVPPGYVIRFAGESSYKTIDAQWADLNLGGIIVESGATEYKFKSTPNNNTRNTTFGDSQKKRETWYVFKEDFEIHRQTNTAKFTIRGPVNIEVADQKTFKVTYSNPTLQDGATLRMHGLGKMTCPKLVATGNVALDFRNEVFKTRETAFIDGELQVDGSTKIHFPAGWEPNATLKLCTGTLNAPSGVVIATIMIGDTESDVRLKYDAENKTVKYSTGESAYWVPNTDNTDAITNGILDWTAANAWRNYNDEPATWPEDGSEINVKLDAKYIGGVMINGQVSANDVSLVCSDNESHSFEFHNRTKGVAGDTTTDASVDCLSAALVDMKDYKGDLGLKVPISCQINFSAATHLIFRTAGAGETASTAYAYTIVGRAGAIQVSGEGQFKVPSSMYGLPFSVDRTATIVYTESKDISGVISGEGNVITKGSGTTTLTAENTVSGGITVEAGTLKSGSNSAFGTGTITVDNGAALDFAGFDSNATGYTVVCNGGTLNATGTIYADHNCIKSLTLGGDSEINGSGRIGVTMADASATTLDLGTYTLTVNGGAYLNLRNTTVSGTGTIDVSNGTLLPWGNVSSASNVSLNLGANGHAEMNVGLTVKNFSMASGATFTGTNNSAITVTGKLSGTGSIPKLTLGNGATIDTTGNITVSNTLTFGNSLKVTGNVNDVIIKGSTYSGALPSVTRVDAEGSEIAETRTLVNVSGAIMFGNAYDGATISASELNAKGDAVIISGDLTINLDKDIVGAHGISATQNATVTIKPTGTKTFISAADVKKLSFSSNITVNYVWNVPTKVINLNFGSSSSGEMSGETTDKTFGGENIPRSAWNGYSANSETSAAVSTGWDCANSETFEITGMTVGYSGRGGNHNVGTKITPCAPFMWGYIDDNSSSDVQVTLSGIPFDRYDVIVYFQGDTAAHFFSTPQIIKGETTTVYSYDSEMNVVTSAVANNFHWGQSLQSDISYEKNVFRIPNQTGDIKVQPQRFIDNNGQRRATIAAIQIVALPAAMIVDNGVTTYYPTVVEALEAATDKTNVIVLDGSTTLPDGYSAYAVGDEGAVVVAVAKIGDKGYATLAKAASAAVSGQEIIPLADITLDNAITITSGASLNIPEDIMIETSADNKITGTITGSGKLVLVGGGFDGAATQIMPKPTFSNWTGTVEIRDWHCARPSEAANIFKVSNYANANSSLIFNGYKGYFHYENSPYSVKSLQIIGKGLNQEGGFSGTRNIVIKAKTISGTGPIVCGLDLGNSANFMLVGDASGYTGNVTANSNYRVVFAGTADDTLPSHQNGSIAIGSTANVTLGSGTTWTTTNGIQVAGTLKLAGGTIANSKTITGSGIVKIEGTGAEVENVPEPPLASTWTGTVELKGFVKAWTKNDAHSHGAINLNKYGNSNSKLVLEGITMTSYASGAATSDNPVYTLKEIELRGNGLTLVRGAYSVADVYNAKLTGSGSLTVSATTKNTSGQVVFKGAHEYSGNITVQHATSDHTKRVALVAAGAATPSQSDSDYESIYVGPGVTVVASDTMTWSAPNGVKFGGTLDLTGGTPTWTGTPAFGNEVTFKLTTMPGDDAVKIMSGTYTPAENPLTLGLTIVVGEEIDRTHMLTLKADGVYIEKNNTGRIQSLIVGSGENRVLLAGETLICEAPPSLDAAGTITVNVAGLEAGAYDLVTWTGVLPREHPGYGKPQVVVQNVPQGWEGKLVFQATKISLLLRDPDWLARKPLTIWPFGDSITEGYNDHNRANYRIQLFQKLELLGYNVKSVGWWTSNRGGETTECHSYDPTGTILEREDWSYHSGVRSGRVVVDNGKNNVLSDAVETGLDQAGDPDVVLLHIGTNDGDPSNANLWEKIYDGITNIAWRVTAARENTKVVLSTILPLQTGHSNYSLNTSSIDKINAKLKEAIDAKVFPEGRVYLADLHSYVPNTPENYVTDHTHPDWIGHDKMAEGWLSVVTNVFTNVSDPRVQSNLVRTAPDAAHQGAAANVPAEYRSGYRRLASMTPSGTKHFALNENAYNTTETGVTASTQLSRVAYFMELVGRETKIHRYVWVDMDAFGSTFADCGFPTANNGAKQQVVNNIHVYANTGAIANIDPSISGKTGFIEFTPYNYGAAASSVTGAPNHQHGLDWNDTLTTSGATSGYGCFQIHAIAPEGPRPTAQPAQVLMAYNRWGNGNTGTTEIGIGNFSQFIGTVNDANVDYTYTYNKKNVKAEDYEVINIEFWGKVPGCVVPDGSEVDVTEAETEEQAVAGLTIATLSEADTAANAGAGNTSGQAQFLTLQATRVGESNNWKVQAVVDNAKLPANKKIDDTAVAFANAGGIVKLAGATEKQTISIPKTSTTAGLYYSVSFGTTPDDHTQESERVLATSGDGTVDIPVPALGNEKVYYLKVKASATK